MGIPAGLTLHGLLETILFIIVSYLIILLIDFIKNQFKPKANNKNKNKKISARIKKKMSHLRHTEMHFHHNAENDSNQLQVPDAHKERKHRFRNLFRTPQTERHNEADSTMYSDSESISKHLARKPVKISKAISDTCDDSCDVKTPVTDAIEDLFVKNMQGKDVSEINKGKANSNTVDSKGHKQMEEPVNPTNPLNVLDNAISSASVTKANKYSQFDKILNFRDICEGEPSRIKSGQIFRSGLIHMATDNDFEILKNVYGIKTCIDMRSIDEVKQHPSPTYEKHFPTRRDFLGSKHCRIHAPLWKVSMNFKILIEAKKYRTIGQIGMSFAKGDRETAIKLLIGEMNEIKLPGMYKCFIKYVQPQIREILDICSNPKNYPILIHCSLGKDRTGVMSSIISDIAGINRHAIFTEYSKSQTNLEPVKKEVIENLRKYYLEEWLADSPIEVLEETFDYIEETYGSMGEFIELIGFDKKKQKQLKNYLSKYSSSN